jgi:MtN3 and saliva related transmembrane protein
MPVTDLLGYLAATLTTLSLVPQVVRVWRTRSAEDLSPGMYVLFTLGVASWLAYGLLLRAWPVVAANTVTLLLAAAVLIGIWRARR